MKEELYIKIRDFVIPVKVTKEEEKFGYIIVDIIPIHGFGAMRVKKENLLKAPDAKLISKIL